MRHIRFVSALPQSAAARREGVTGQEREQTIRHAFEIRKRQISKAARVYAVFSFAGLVVLLEFGACMLD